MASCRMRGSPSVPVNLPKLELVMPVFGLAEVGAIEQVECFKPELAESRLAQRRDAETFDHRDVHIRKARAFQNIPAQSPQRVRRRIAETAGVEVPRDLLPFAAVGRQHRVSWAN